MRIAIIGNSGSGKSTLARMLANSSDTSSLDLDTLVWEPGKVAVQRDPTMVFADLEHFCSEHHNWVIEGCYADYIQAVLKYEPELLFLDPGRDACRRNCLNRPWEPHKYASMDEQESKLEYLLRWVDDYYQREGDMSLKGHQALFDVYHGPKRIIKTQPTQQDMRGG